MLKTKSHTKITKKVARKPVPSHKLAKRAAHTIAIAPMPHTPSIQTTAQRSISTSHAHKATTRVSQPFAVSVSNNAFNTNNLHNVTKRSLFIQTQDTPNPRSLKFVPGKIVLPDKEDGSQTTVFFDQSQRGLARKQCTLAYTILLIEGVMNVMLGSDFITVTTTDDTQDWMIIKPQVFAAISDAFGSDEPILKPSEEIEPSRELETLPGDEEAVGLIKEIIDLRIRPTVMEDGGDVEFIKFDQDRIVWLLMKGSCSGCPSSGATLKNGIQNMIMHYVPEVVAVEEWKDEAALISDLEFEKLEAKLASQKH